MQPTFARKVSMLPSTRGKRWPRFLYHYTSSAGMEGILRSRQVWASAVQYLSDSEELSYAAGLASEIIEAQERRARSLLFELLRPGLQQVLYDIGTSTVCVFSLSEVGDLLSQWRAYCPATGGFAVGFSARRLGSLLAAQQLTLAPCTYKRARQISIVQDLVSRAERHFRKGMNAHGARLAARTSSLVRDRASRRIEIDCSINTMRAFRADFLRAGPFIKHPSFSEEREWRVVSDAVPTTNPALQYHHAKSMLVPHLCIDLPPIGRALLIDRIVVGPSAHQDRARASLDVVLARLNVRCGNIRRSRTPYRGE